jgi:hypothetical protein
MNILQLITQVNDELGISRPALVVGTTDAQIRQSAALLNRLGSDLCNQFEWQRLNKENIIATVSYSMTGTTTVGSSVITGIASTTGLSNQFAVTGTGARPFSQITTVNSTTSVTMNMPATVSGTATFKFAQVQYNLPSDWNREIPQTEWDRTNRWPLMGPQSPQDWQSFKSGIVYAGPRERFRILGNTYTINPPPPDGLIFSMEYISNAWVVGLDGTAKSSFTADTDTTIFSDSLLISGLKTQWKAAKGLDASFDLADFQSLLEREKGQDKSAPTLSLSGGNGSVLMNMANVMEGNFPAQ